LVDPLRRSSPITASLLAFVLLVMGTHGLSAQEVAPQSYTEAMEWYRKGAEAGDPKAQFFLGLALEEGTQGRQDLVAARGMFERAGQGRTCLGLVQARLDVAIRTGRSN
jgi:TPR repeat protein